MAVHSKPPKVPRWADNPPAGAIVEPGESKKDRGWELSEKPAFSYFNWLNNLSGEWLKWFDERFGDGSTKDELKIMDPGSGVRIELAPVPESKLHVSGGAIRGDRDKNVAKKQSLELRRYIGSDFDGTALTVDIGMDQGLANLVAGAEINADGKGYSYLGLRGASRILLNDGEINFSIGGVPNPTKGLNVDWATPLTIRPIKDQNQKVIGGNVGIGTEKPFTPLHIVTAIGNDDDAYGNPMLWGQHIEIGAKQMWGMKDAYGTLYTWNSDSLFIGLKNEGENRKDPVIAFGDDTNDALRFLFTPFPQNPNNRIPPPPNELMRITGDGKVGIGTDKPGATLEVAGNIMIATTIAPNTGSLNQIGKGSPKDLPELPGIEFSDDLYVANDLGVGDSLRVRNRFGVYAENENSFIMGKLGIGTASPGCSLEVNGGIRARGGAPGANGANKNGYAFSGGGGDNDSGMFSSADGQLEFYTNAVERMRVSSTGSVTLENDLDVKGQMKHNGTAVVGYMNDGKPIYAKRISGTFAEGVLSLSLPHGIDKAYLDNRILLVYYYFDRRDSMQHLSIISYRQLNLLLWYDDVVSMERNDGSNSVIIYLLILYI